MGLGETDDFAELVAELLKQIDLLLAQVKQCADAVDQLNSLTTERDRKQGEFSILLAKPTPPQGDAQAKRTQEIEELRRQIDALEKPIEELYRPFITVKANVSNFVAAVRDVLDYTPVEPLRFKEIRSEIERLLLLTSVGGPATVLPMKMTLNDLLKVKHRLREFLSFRATPGDSDEGTKGPSHAKRSKPSPAALIGSWLKSRRESQRTLARKAGISPNTLRKIMDGKPVRSDSISAVAEVLGCRYEDLLPS